MKLLCLIPALLLASLCSAQVSLPLEGYYRPGKYFPVRIASASASGQLVVGPPSGVRTTVPVSLDGPQVVVPAILMEQTPSLAWQLGSWGGNLPLKLLTGDQRLIGFTSPDPSLAQELFPDRQIIPIPLDPANLLPGSPAAWSTLDALLLDPSTKLDPERISILLGCGVTLASTSAAPPDSDWPWEHQGKLWVLRARIRGPRWGGENVLPFEPVAGWQADWPGSFRGRILLFAAIFSIFALAASLLRRRFSLALVLAVAFIGAGAMAWWWHGRSAVLEKTALIQVVSPQLTQTDAWSYRASVSPARASNPWDAVTWPVFESMDWPFFHLQLHCRADGAPDRFTYDCPPSLKVAFFSRIIDREKPRATGGGVTPDSDLFLLAHRSYGVSDPAMLGRLSLPPPTKNPESQWLGALVIRVSD